jgi:polysaccharide biosynthesis protein PelG
MAGIGFELRKAVQEASYLGAIRGYLYAAIISSGPWLLSVLTLTLLGVISLAFLPQESRDLFSATMTHSFAMSLITVGFIQMVVTRYLADKLFIHDTEALVPAFVTVLVVTSIAQFMLMYALLATTALPLQYRVCAAALYVAISGIWIAMIFLSAARDYVSIVLAFLIGYSVSAIAALGMSLPLGPIGYLIGFAGGQFLLLMLLAWRVIVEFPSKETFNVAVFKHARRYPSLLAIGIIYNLAFWIDKFVFWFSHEGIDARTFLRMFPPYDTSFFIASLTMVPAIAVFIVKIETQFYDHYRDFYASIANKRSWRDIAAAKQAMVDAMPGMYLTLLKIQTAIALLTIGFTPLIMSSLRIAPSYWYIFRIAVVALGVQVFLLITILILLYLDLRGSVLIVSCVFLITNLGFTLATIQAGYAYYGYGFLLASLVSLVVALLLLDNRMRNLEYLTFVRQPLSPEG